MEDAASDPPAGPTLVNLGEMARLLQRSLPTMRELPIRYPDMPVVQRGGAGTQWQFDPAAVLAFMAAQTEREEAEERARAERLAALAQPTLLDGDIRGQSELGLSSKDYGQEIRNARELDKLRTERGFLIDKSQMRFLLENSWRVLANSLSALPAQMGRKHNLPEAVVRDMRKYLQEQQVAIHGRLSEFLAPDVRADEGEDESAVEPFEGERSPVC
jgi:phage terminase Nu1 subunit (DNA packaging protein)